MEPGTAYRYSVTADNAQGSSMSSASASASVPEAPGEPGGLAAELAEADATDETASVTLTWTASTVPPAAQCKVSYPLDGYTVLRSDGGQETEVATPGKGIVSFTDERAAFGAAYTYRVIACSGTGAPRPTRARTAPPAGRKKETKEGLARTALQRAGDPTPRRKIKLGNHRIRQRAGTLWHLTAGKHGLRVRPDRRRRAADAPGGNPAVPGLL